MSRGACCVFCPPDSCILVDLSKLVTEFVSCGQDQAQCRDSRSTLSGGRGGGAFDYLGRPVLHNNSRKTRDRHLDIDEENQLRVETFVRDATMSLVRLVFLSLVFSVLEARLPPISLLFAPIAC